MAALNTSGVMGTEPGNGHHPTRIGIVTRNSSTFADTILSYLASGAWAPSKGSKRDQANRSRS